MTKTTSDRHGPEAIRKDAEGQFANPKTGGKSSGVASAKPTVITGSEDATAHKLPPGRKEPKKDWEVKFDITERSRNI
ncbi:hypothetical protein QTA58_14035 [Neorhizobium sp. CSC1952]|uniref:Uncharacterized protein n=1 Tax=Xaviernesmea oryzae TaxID=464029 RepID=A0A1X7D4A5_9HYPH|nr:MULTISPECIES: hypothetical protein [Rhizobium/Agrobacterium group]WJR65362.1 hypothetical protein QTA58_14035 [Rhizobium sp. CSC1952]SMF08659.1 hypothetical protein SAMN02982989_5015 [Xaviernesmea oryzae]